uniref:RNA-directed DNA polymerase n=1 Tax=Globodera rostochiensis TaxID=31243 RepID=A0A914IEX9_GLORO
MATSEQLQAILAAQQKQFADLLAKVLPVAPSANNSDLFSQINTQVPQFNYDPEADETFSLWWDRFGSFVEKDGKAMGEDMKVRLILGKLSATEYLRYEQQVSPQKPAELGFQPTILALKSLFGDTKSVFVRRFEVFQLCCGPTQSVMEFGAIVNARCERADMTLTKEEIKCLIFVTGLSDAHKDLRQECLRQMEKARKAIPPKAITLEALLEECRAIQSLQNSAAALAPAVHTIQVRPQRVKESPKKRYQGKSADRPNVGRNFGEKWDKKREFVPANRHEINNSPRLKCERCGNAHEIRRCNYPPNVQCFGCGRVGHIKQICRSSRHETRVQSHAVFSTFSVAYSNREWIWIQLHVNGRPLQLAADSCSHLTIIQRPLWISLGEPKLNKVGKRVGSFSGHKLQLLGSFNCHVQFRNVDLQLECWVADTDAPSIMGLEWIRPFEQATQQPVATTLSRQSVPTVLAIQSTEDPQDLASQIKMAFPQVFEPGLGLCTKTKATLHLKQNAKPIFCRARPVPHGVQDEVDRELERLEAIGAIRPVDFSRWAAPVLAVRKKIKPAPVAQHQRHFSRTAWVQNLSQLDLRDAYLQLELDEPSKPLVGINTHRGLFQYQRLPFGVKSAPSIFQKVMDQMTAGLPGVFAYLDDIIIASANLADHMSILFKLFSKIQDYGFRIQLEKCHFLRTDLKFLGHVVSSQGIRPDPDRSAAIREMPPPHDVSTLRSFLGAINYYGRFIKQMSELRAPLDSLLKKDSPWSWGKEQQSAFDKAKQILLSDLLLTHYDPTRPIVVAADASQYGIGATLSHKGPDGSERVVEHACRTLTTSERNYAQIEREALALIFACQKFHRMIYGRKFVLLTDHKPLLAIFGSKKGIPIYTAARLQRWALTLANYDFTIQYVKSENFGQADVLSRLVASHRSDEDHIVAHTHVDEEHYNVDDVTEYVYMANLESLPVSSEEVSEHTGTDELLQQVVGYVRSGWPDKCPANDLMPFFQKRNTLTTVGGSLLTGNRVVIPQQLRRRVLVAVHFSHPGVVRMKALARSHVYWPGMDHGIEQMVKQCSECQSAAKLPPKAPSLYGRSNIFDPRRCFIQMAGNHRNALHTARSTITALSRVFHRYGTPVELVSDNGPPFSSYEFQQFCNQNGIKHSFSPPYQPHCNGQAERMVDTFKRQAKKNASSPAQDWISNFLFAYRTTPSQLLQGLTPAELFLGRKLRTPLSRLQPAREKNVEVHRDQYREQMRKQYGRRHGAVDRHFEVGSPVLTLNYGRMGRPAWLEGKIVDGRGLVWKVRLPTLGITVTRHSNQMRPFTPCQTENAAGFNTPRASTPPRVQPPNGSPRPQVAQREVPAPMAPIPISRTPRPQRQRKPPDRFSPGRH